MAEIWVWYSDICRRESELLLIEASRLLGENEILRAVAVQEEKISRLPDICASDTVLRCAKSGSPAYKGYVLAEMAKKYRPEIIVFPAGFESSAVASTAAAVLDTGLSADCTQLRRENSLLIMHRPAFGGGVVADIVCRDLRPQMATVRPDALVSVSYARKNAAEELFVYSDRQSDNIRLISAVTGAMAKSISSADIIISGGRGVGSKENFALLQELADAMGGMLGASRAAVDAGFAPWRCQVGQTGTTVHPKLYLAFGISGSVQHIAGMHASDFVAAVNTDPKAPIFDYSDMAIISDWRESAEYILAQIK